VYYSNEYIKSYKCKLLGIGELVSPFEGNDLDLNEYIFIDLAENLAFDDMPMQQKEFNNSSQMTPLESVIEGNKLSVIVRTNTPEIQKSR
jgi:hypothetical protein